MGTKQQQTRPNRLSLFQIVRNRLKRLVASFSAIFTAQRRQLATSTTATATATPSLPHLLAAAMAPAKTTPFKAYDLQRRHIHTIEGSGGKSAPRKTSIHRIVRSEWAVPKVTKPARSSPRKSTKKASKAASLTAASLLRADDIDACCWHCGRWTDDPECGTMCYTAFKEEADAEKLIEIKGPGKHGYGAFTKPACSLKKGQLLGEYVGQLTPLDHPSTSLYRFEIPGTCAIDAEPCGNWTRFVNSSCEPNCAAFTETIGKRHAVFFQALRDVGPEEELTFNYGKGYFAQAGFLCGCPAMKRPHLPGEAKAKAKEKAKGKAKK